MEIALSVCNSLIKAGYPEESSKLLEARINSLATKRVNEKEKIYRRQSR